MLYFSSLIFTDNSCKPQHALKVVCFALTPILDWHIKSFTGKSYSINMNLALSPHDKTCK